MQGSPELKAVDQVVTAVMAGLMDPSKAVDQTSDFYRPFVVTRLMRAGAPPKLLRPALEKVWVLNHNDLLGPMGRDNVIRMFRAAAFQAPDCLPRTFTVWRGTQGQPLARARNGMSWTTSRPVACAFACWPIGGTARRTPPIVIKRQAKRSDVLMATDLGCQAEVVLGLPPGGEVDGHPDEWDRTATLYATKLGASIRDAA